MSKFSSRLQSRIAKRRAVIRHFEDDRHVLKVAVNAGRQLVGVGILHPGAYHEGVAQYREVRKGIKEMVIGQQLDKELLRYFYGQENATFDLASATIVLEDETRL